MSVKPSNQSIKPSPSHQGGGYAKSLGSVSLACSMWSLVSAGLNSWGSWLYGMFLREKCDGNDMEVSISGVPKMDGVEWTIH